MYVTPASTRLRLPSTRAALVASVVVGVSAMVGLAFTRCADAAPPAATQQILLATEDFTFSERSVSAPAGRLELTLANLDAVPHTFTVAALDIDLVVGGGEVRSLTVDVIPGEYDFVCTIPGHDGPGMRGELVIQ